MLPSNATSNKFYDAALGWLCIIHWMEIWEKPFIAILRETYLADDCPYCKEFTKPFCGNGQRDCPVKRLSGQALCNNTPWIAFAKYAQDVRDIRKQYSVRLARTLIEDELLFLFSTLPDPDAALQDYLPENPDEITDPTSITTRAFLSSKPSKVRRPQRD